MATINTRLAIPSTSQPNSCTPVSPLQKDTHTSRQSAAAAVTPILPGNGTKSKYIVDLESLGFIEQFQASSKADRTTLLETKLQGSKYNITNTVGFADIVVGTDSSEWEIDECKVIGRPKATWEEVRASLSFSAYRPDKYDLHTPFTADLVDGRAIAVINDAGELHLEAVTGTLKESACWKKARRPSKNAPVGSPEWVIYWRDRSWTAKQDDPTVRWLKIEGHGIAVAEDKFVDGYRYGVAAIPGNHIEWNTDDVYDTQEQAKRAALDELADILSQ